MRLIDGDALMTWFDNHYDDEEVTVGYISGLIKEQPTISEHKTGKWIRKSYDDNRCSECGWGVWANTGNYCPNCGADMRGET